MMHPDGMHFHHGPREIDTGVTRRDFLRGSLALGAGIVVSRLALDAWEPVLAQAAESQLPPVTSFLKQDQVQELLKIALSKGAEFAEVYGEYTINTAFVLDENELRQAQYGILSGVGVRVLSGEVTGYAYADDYEMASLREAARVAASAAASGAAGKPKAFAVSPAKSPFVLQRPAPLFTTEIGKIERCQRANQAARAKDPRIKQVQVTMADTAKAILVANSEGLWAEDRQFISSLVCVPTAIDGTNRQTGISIGGGAVELDYFETNTPEMIANDAADTAIALLGAVDAKAGSYPVIINKGWGGVLVHECFGHSLEGDGIRKKTSIREKQFGQKVCADIVDIYDDSTVPNCRGSFKVDDEGTPSQKSHVVEKGILKGYLWDRLNAKLTGNVSSGNGRRNSYRDYPIPRMTNTYIGGGTSDPQALLGSVKNGLFCKSLGGGSVNPADGNFSFVVQEAYLIEGGKITSAVKGATLTGNAADAMLRVEGLGNDLKIDTTRGTCGKDGQFKPVGVGQPTVLFSEMTVGGTRA
ncbi:MAG: TldD/PmbA family protein [Candidatus Eiseniibacteriota bacterium]